MSPFLGPPFLGPWLKKAGLDVSTMPNLRVMPSTTDPREFLRLSRLILMPSVWQETFSRIPVEAFLNGIPVLASRRGGLPENLAEAGFLVDIPARYTEQTRVVPSADEVKEWLRLIVQLWDDDAAHKAESQRCLAAADAFSPAVIGARYERAFRTLLTRRPPPNTIAPGTSIPSLLSGHLSAGGRVHELTDELLDGLLGIHQEKEQ